MKLANFRYSFLFFSCLVVFISAGLINTNYSKPPVEISKQDSAFNFNDDLILLSSAGQKRLITDLFWIVTLLEADVSHYNKQDLNSWLYLRFKTIIKLDPLFLNAYRFGGKYLSIVKDDLLGAKEIFDQGLSKYPDDYNLIYDAAFLYSFELQDSKIGSTLYKRLAQFPQAPDFITSLANKLDYEVHKDLNLTFKVVKKIWEGTPDDTNLKQRLKKDLYNIQAEIDLTCLNSGHINCNKVDFFGDKYLFNGKIYYTQTPHKPYRVKIKN